MRRSPGTPLHALSASPGQASAAEPVASCFRGAVAVLPTPQSHPEAGGCSSLPPPRPLPGALQAPRAACLAEPPGAVCKRSRWSWLLHKTRSVCGFCLRAVTLAAADGHGRSRIPPPRYLVTTHPHKKQLIPGQLPGYASLGCLVRCSFIWASLHTLSFPSSTTVKQNPACDQPALAL